MFFLDLQGFAKARRVEPAAALDAQLRALGVSGEHIPPELPGRAALYRSLLAGLDGRMLLVLDNADEASQVVPLLPGDRRHRVLVTSRNTLSDLTSARHHALGVLDAEAAVALLAGLRTVAHDGDDRIARAGSAADELAELCGFLPLALTIAGSLLAGDPDLPVAELVDVLADRAERLTELSTSERSVRAAVGLSYDRLALPAARMFRLLAVNPGPTMAVGAAAALADLPKRAARRSLDILRRAHLLEPAGARGWFRYHDLIRLYAEERLREDEPAGSRDAAFRRLLGHFSQMLTDAALPTMPKQLVEERRLDTTGTFDSPAEAFAWFDMALPNLVSAVNLAVRTRFPVSEIATVSVTN